MSAYSEKVAKYKKQLEENPDDPRHGTVTGYRYGCKCKKCIEAGRLAGKDAYCKRADSIDKTNSKIKRSRELRSNPDDPRHGTTYGYNCGCRCERCKQAEKERCKRSRAARLKELEANPDDHRHGTKYGYACGCRCERCRQAEKDYSHRYRRTPYGIVASKKASFKSKAKALKELKANPNDHRHGTRYGYSCGCRCERCTTVNSQYFNQRNKEKKD